MVKVREAVGGHRETPWMEGYLHLRGSLATT
jgi:hypothetical protein